MLTRCDLGLEVNLGNAELDFQARDFDSVVGDDVPADVAPPAVKFRLGLFLADEFLQALLQVTITSG